LLLRGATLNGGTSTDSIPAELDRRIRALAALFEVADKEFLAIRDQSQQLKHEAKTRAPDEPEQQRKPPEPLDVFAALAMLGEFFPVYHFMPSHVDGFVKELVELKSDVTDKDFASAHRKHIGTVERFAEYVEGSVHRKFNPFTRMRHALYLFDRRAFRGVLFDLQRQSFDKWLAARQHRK
jgi:putative GTP pyrophosphokinase